LPYLLPTQGRLPRRIELPEIAAAGEILPQVEDLAWKDTLEQ
jgi:hypothetical protein